MMHLPLQHLAVNAFRLWDNSSDVCIHCQIGRWPFARSANDGRCSGVRRQCRNVEISWNIWMLICCSYRSLINISVSICIQQSFLAECSTCLKIEAQCPPLCNERPLRVNSAESFKKMPKESETQTRRCTSVAISHSQITISWCTCRPSFPFTSIKHPHIHREITVHLSYSTCSKATCRRLASSEFCESHLQGCHFKSCLSGRSCDSFLFPLLAWEKRNVK